MTIIIDDDGMMHKVITLAELDKIRAEIAEPLKYHGSDEDYDEGFDCATRRALQIIEKYRVDESVDAPVDDQLTIS